MFSNKVLLGQRYEVQEILGAGGFGDVTKCLNVQTQQLEAVKVMKTRQDCIKKAQREIEINKHLRRWAPDADNLVKWNSFFFHEEDICLSFEVLDCNLRTYIKEHTSGLKGEILPLSRVKPIIYQLATALDCLKSVGVIHADLKPENVLVADRCQLLPKLKLGDFGGAQLSSNPYRYEIIRTLVHSPPEILIQSMFNEAIDVWALGIIAVQLVTGITLYQGKNAYAILKGILTTQGQPPEHILNHGRRTSKYFHWKEDSDPCWIFKTPEEYERETGDCCPRKSNVLSCLDDIPMIMAFQGQHERDQHLFTDLIKGMLELDFIKRFTPQQVLQHPFFADCIPYGKNY